MSIRVVQLGSPRQANEGVRIGTVRRPPRGVSRKDYARLDYYDVWLPELAPSAALLQRYRSGSDYARNWKKFMLQYERELGKPPAARVLELLAVLSRSTNFSIGCYCVDQERCHRSTLRALLEKHGAQVVQGRRKE
jgi:uncharacterized protein YeaO (DUF488 family)